MVGQSQQGDLIIILKKGVPVEKGGALLKKGGAETPLRTMHGCPHLLDKQSFI